MSSFDRRLWIGMPEIALAIKSWDWIKKCIDFNLMNPKKSASHDFF